MENKADVTRLRKWIAAARPWSFPASTMPVIFGTSLAVVAGGASLNPFYFLLAFLAMVILHAAANMLSDAFDFQRGLDRDVTPVSGAVVRGWLSVKDAKRGAAVLFVAGSAAGLALAGMTGRALLVVGAIGVAVGLFYTLLKYHALGDLAVFLDFGILGSLGAWIVQTRAFSWLPVIWAVPMAMLVSAILHANNWRDTVTDSEREVKTMASLLGDRRSLAYYGLLVFGPFALVFLFIVLPRLFPMPLRPMPWRFSIVVLALPMALRLLGRALRRRAPRKPLDFVILDGATAQLNLAFGLLYSAAAWLPRVLPFLGR